MTIGWNGFCGKGSLDDTLRHFPDFYNERRIPGASVSQPVSRDLMFGSVQYSMAKRIDERQLDSFK